MITANYSTGPGGGITLSGDSDAVIEDNEISFNFAENGGGGIAAWVNNTFPTITGNVDALEPTGSGFERYLQIHDSVVFGNGDDSLAGWTTVFAVTGSVVADPAWIGIDGNTSIDPADQPGRAISSAHRAFPTCAAR